MVATAWMRQGLDLTGSQDLLLSSNTILTKADSVALTGLIGLVTSVGFGLAGLWFWPFKSRTRIRSREENLAAYDHITGLPTLRLFTVLLDQALSRATQLHRRVGVLVAELHQFRPMAPSDHLPNVSLIVRVEAARIKSALLSTNTVARIGDRRFAVLIEEAGGRTQLDAVAQKIQQTMSLPLMIEGQEILLSCHIGGLLSTLSPSTAEHMLSQAVKSLAQATSDNPIRFYHAGSDDVDLREVRDAVSSLESAQP